jgi:hypothetical protein
MTSRHMENRSKDTIERTNWRYRIGIWMFCAPFFMSIVAAITIPALGFSVLQTTVIVGAVAIAAQVIWFASIPVLGHKGFLAMKSRAYTLIKPKEGPIGKTRYRVGTILLVASLLGEVALKLALLMAFFSSTNYGLELPIWGVTYQLLAITYVSLEITIIVVLISSFYMLGADFMERLVKVFEWPGEEDWNAGV